MFVILKNLIVLMMVFLLGMMCLVPKMMEGLAPGEKECMKQQMVAQQDPTKILGELFGESFGGATTGGSKDTLFTLPHSTQQPQTKTVTGKFKN